jgi:hypothetical protein
VRSVFATSSKLSWKTSIAAVRGIPWLSEGRTPFPGRRGSLLRDASRSEASLRHARGSNSRSTLDRP